MITMIINKNHRQTPKKEGGWQVYEVDTSGCENCDQPLVRECNMISLDRQLPFVPVLDTLPPEVTIINDHGECGCEVCA